MFMMTGARNRLLEGERQKFLKEQWPQIRATIQRLGLTPQDLPTATGEES
jgi:GntR family transcriptional regulator